MPSLTPELITKILRLFLYRDDGQRRTSKEIACLAAVSRTWQAFIEPRTFGALALTQHDFVDAARIVTPARQRLVGNLEINIVLDRYDDEARRRVESAAEQHHNNAVFTAAMRSLFELIRDWKPVGREGSWLRVHVWSPSDIDRLPPDEADALVRRLPFSPLRRYEASLIRFLDDPDTLPALPHVEHLFIQRCPPDDARGRNLYRAVDAASAALLASKCVRLTWLSLYLMDWPRGAVEERKHRRRVLAGVLDDLPARIRRLTLVYWGSAPRDERHDTPSLLGPGETQDPLSLSLRRFYMRSRAKSLFVSRTIVGLEAFAPERRWERRDGERDDDDDDDDDDDRDSRYDSEWAGAHSEEDQRPSADLQDLHIDSPDVTADGRWLCQRAEGKLAERLSDADCYIVGTPPADDEDTAPGPADPDPELDHPAYAKQRHQFRVILDRALSNALLKAIARTMRRMPSLQDVMWSLSCGSSDGYRIEYMPNFDDGGGILDFNGFGFYQGDGEPLDTGEPWVDQEVLDYFTQLLSARKPRGEVIIEVC